MTTKKTTQVGGEIWCDNLIRLVSKYPFISVKGVRTVWFPNL